jgi:O-antigen/teichoic acid export membrane protein
MLGSVGLFGMAIAAQRVASFVLLPFNTRYLTTADYGMLDLIEQISTPLSILLGMSLSLALGYFYNQREDEDWRQTVTSTILIGTVAVGLVAGVAGWLIVPLVSQGVLGNQTLTPYLLVAVLCFPISGFVEAMMSWLRIRNNAWLYLKVSVLRLILVVGLTIFSLAVLEARVWAVLGSNLLGYAVCAVLLALYYFQKWPVRFKRELIGPMFRYAFPMGISYLAMFVLLFGDRLVLPRYISMSEIGIYSVACKFGALLTLIHGSFAAYFNAQVFQIVERPDARQIFSRLFVYMTLGVCGAALGLVAFAPLAIEVFTAPAFHSASALAPVIVLAFLFRILCDYFRNLFFTTNHTRQEAIANWLSSLLCLGAYFVLIPRFGAAGAAWSTLVAFLFSLILIALWSHRYWPYQLDTRRLLLLGSVWGLLFGLSLLPLAGFWLRAAWSSFLVLAFPALLWMVGFFTASEIAQARRLIASRLSRNPEVASHV